jgi:D-arabinan exo alpha-(1,3)/(1,5)-arabinofuranosidase (non-reducing end)
MRARVGMIGLVAFSLIAASACQGPGPGTQTGGPSASAAVIGVDELARLDLLPRLKRSVKVGLVSSYDRTGGNDDGFSGRYSFVRREPGGLVLADLEGPGAIYRIHTPTPTEDRLEFCFDNEDAPRLGLKVIELFDGSRPPFVAPLAAYGVGGYTSYVPLTYAKSCKIVLRAESFQFYDINYAVFPEGTEVATYADPPPADFMAKVGRAAGLMKRAGSDISDAVAPPGARLAAARTKARLAPGGKAVLFESSTPGRVVGLRLRPASALAGAERDIVLRAYWDGAAEPAVDCPAGDFFGASFGEPATRSLVLGTTAEDLDYCYFPMPFARAARIELVSERPAGSAPVEVEAEVVTAAAGKAADEGRFYARWRRENPCPEGRPYTYLRTTGRGNVVGVILQAQGVESGHTGFFEGDDRAVIDGRLAVPGTGSEDSFNGGWYDVPGRWETRTSLPLSGCLDYKKPQARTGGYRFMLTDAYAYAESIDYTIEHGPEGNAVPTDYASVVFFYSQDPPPGLEPLPAAAERRTRGLDRIVFVPGWNVPVRTASLQNATWTKGTIAVGKERVRIFSMRTSGPDIFGPHHVAFVCDLPEAGRYRLSVKAVLGPDQGLLRVFERDRPAGEPVNLYAPERTVGGPLPLGEFEMRRGDNTVYLHLVGADPRSSGMGLDLAELVFEKVK